MKTTLPPILITSCVIVSDQTVALKDQNTRVRLTLEAIDRWLSIAPDLKLVICDGSNFDFTELVKNKFPKAAIESLFFQNNKELVKLHGKGFGEGEIVNYAIRHSGFLKQTEFFAKCTSKLWVDNFLDCFDQWNGMFLCKGVFEKVFSLRKTQFAYVDTRFYIVNKDFYQNYLSSAYLNVGGEQGLSLEHCFRDVIVNKQLHKVLLTVPPVICGVGGGSGTYYKNNLKRRIKEIIRLWLVRQDTSFASLF